MYHIYTDGSSRLNKVGEGIGAHGYAVVDDNNKLVADFVSGEFNTTNNRQEMLAVIDALDWLSEGADQSAIIYTDSNLVYKGINEWLAGWKSKGWKKADKSEVLNKDLWMRIDEMLARMTVFVEKVPGHKDNAWNNYVDNLVQNESMRLKNG